MNSLRFPTTPIMALRTLRRTHTGFFCLFSLCLLSALTSASQGQSEQRQKSVVANRKAASNRPVSFLNEIEPTLTRAGCNQGACHGSQFGKGGFKLSLAGYDPDFDYESIVKQERGRRVVIASPSESLLLKKPLLALPHQGGLKLKAGSADHNTLARWLRQGAPGPNSRDPHPVTLRAIPERRTLSVKGTQSLKVQARFSDGSERDVTAHTRIASLNEEIATVTPEGKVTARGRGETAIMLRYGGLATVARIAVPYAPGKTSLPAPLPDTRSGALGEGRAGFTDRLTTERWRELGLTPAGRCTDSEFIRRASLDIIGVLPTPEEVRAFQAERHPQKDARLIDRLLARPEYVDYWALKWGDLLRNSRATLGVKAMWNLNYWLRDNFSRNRPYDAFVRELLTAQGSALTEGPANYFRVASTPNDLAETTAQVFLGIRLQCAKCHQHPFEKWSQKDYYQFAAFFARVGVKEVREPGQTLAEPIVRLLPTGEVTHPKTGARMAPTPLALENLTPAPSPVAPLRGGRGESSGKSLPSPSEPERASGRGGGGEVESDRRIALAEWMTDKNNRQFAQTVVNRYWGHFLGRGIVDPVDDMRVTNPPSNPQLLDALAADFVARGYDLKRLIRTISTSRAYRLSSRTKPQQRTDPMFTTHFLPRRQPAEVLLDSLSIATGTEEKFAGLPPGTRAIQLPDATVASPFLDTFGRPPRTTACECERTDEPSLTQALLLLNSEPLNRKVTQPNGRAAQLAESKKSGREIVEELYYVTLSRPPSPEEQKIALRVFASAKSRRQAVEDLLWALLNTKEFAMIQ